MRTLEINERFAEYFDELDYGQMTQLEKSLKADLTSEPILWWHNVERDRDELLDGHHRYSICKRLRLEPQFHEKHFESEDEALLFIIRNQTTRRNIVNRDRVVKLAVDLEVRLGNKTKTEAVASEADIRGVSIPTIWRALAEEEKPNVVQEFHATKADLEQRLTREKTKAVEKFKVQAAKEQLDEDTASEKWQEIEATIDAQFAEDIAQVESLGEAASQAIEDNPGLRNTGKKRPAKKSVRDRAAKRNTMKKALSLISKMQSEVFYFWQQNVGVIDITVAQQALKRVAAEIEAEQEADAKAAKKKKFGGK